MAPAPGIRVSGMGKMVANSTDNLSQRPSRCGLHGANLAAPAIKPPEHMSIPVLPLLKPIVWECQIQHKTIILPDRTGCSSPRVHRYRGSRPLSVAALATAAAAGALALSGGISSAIHAAEAVGQ